MKESNSKRKYFGDRRHFTQPLRSESIRTAADLFHSGYALDLDGKSDGADSIYRNTIEFLDEISSQSNDPIDVLELASLAHQHGIELFRLGKYDEARLAFERARELFDSLVLLDASYSVIASLADALLWLARTQRKTGRGIESTRTYERVIDLWKTLGEFPQSDEVLEIVQHKLATALYGYSKVLKQHGQKLKAKRCKEEARELSPLLRMGAE